MISPRQTTEWWREAVLYHIYPLSFADSNADGYGDLRGIIKHLDYLNDGTAESLGVGAIWLSPIYRSPMVDWGYDVSDHCAVDPRFGTLEDFDELVREVHARNMKLLLDFVPNHTSNEHPWFLESRQTRDNDYRDWYLWADPKPDGSAPNNWLSYFGGSAWSLDEPTGQYYLHSFLPEQPDLNWRHPKVRAAMIDVMHFWLQRGVDGFRTDAVYGLIKDLALRDDPPNPNFIRGKTDPSEKFLRVHSAGQKELSEVLGSFCDTLAEKPGRYLVSEAYLNVAGLHQLYGACVRHPVHAPFNFNLMGLPWDAQSFGSFISEYEASLGPHDWPNYVLGNHDRHRLATRIGPGPARMLSMLQLTLRGLPVIYYGDELGLEDGNIPQSEERDPWGIRVPGYGLGRDVARTPLPWAATSEIEAFLATDAPKLLSTSPQSSTAPRTRLGKISRIKDYKVVTITTTRGHTSWLPLGPDALLHNVSTEARDPESSLALYRHLIHLRSTLPALREGEWRHHKISDVPDVLAYAREAGDMRCWIILNFSSRKLSVHLGHLGTWIAGTHEVMGDGKQFNGGVIDLEPYEGRLYNLQGGRK